MKNVIEVGEKINLDGKSRSVESHSIKNGLLSIILKKVKQKKSKKEYHHPTAHRFAVVASLVAL